MKNLIKYLVSSLVDYPDEVRIDEHSLEQGFRYLIHVSRRDLGKIIGKRGRTAKAMRLVISALAAPTKKEIILEIVEPLESENTENSTMDSSALVT